MRVTGLLLVDLDVTDVEDSLASDDVDRVRCVMEQWAQELRHRVARGAPWLAVGQAGGTVVAAPVADVVATLRHLVQA